MMGTKLTISKSCLDMSPLKKINKLYHFILTGNYIIQHWISVKLRLCKTIQDKQKSVVFLLI